MIFVATGMVAVEGDRTAVVVSRTAVEEDRMVVAVVGRFVVADRDY